MYKVYVNKKRLLLFKLNTFINKTQHIKRKENSIIISISTDKALDAVQYPSVKT